MNLSILFRRALVCILIAGMLIPLAACMGEGEVTDTQTDIPADPVTTVLSEDTEPDAPAKKKIELIIEGKLNYTIVRPEVCTAVGVRAATGLRNFVKSQGIECTLTDWESDDANTPEILVGITKQFPEEVLESVDLSRLGPNGFIIKVHGAKILLAANNDKALVEATEYFCANFLDVAGGKTSMSENYFSITSNGTLLSSLTLGGVNIAEYALACDSGFEEPMSYIKELVKDKCGAELAASGEKKILLTSAGAEEGKISARFEGGNLVITAKDAQSMKKAVICFWYETIGHKTGTYDLPADTNYSRDLAQTVFYSDHGVKQSENECCMDAMIAAHNYANEKGYKVFADYGAKYYLASTGKTVTIKTDVEWGNAEITIDDSGVSTAARGNWIFTIPASAAAYNIDTVKTLKRDQTNIGITLPQKSFVSFYDETTKHYIRSGGNADSGATKVDNLVVNTDGSIDTDAPIMWDFDTITGITVRPIDETVITVSGGVVTTIANKAPSEYTYYARGILISRSNIVIDGVEHYVTGEGATGAPYNGFIRISSCAYVTVQNCVFTGHKTYKSSTTKMGSYDIGMGNTISVSFINCSQANDINDDDYWGVSGTNYCKNFVYDGCILSRFDAHKGVTNATIKNSVIGHAGATIIGYGTLIIENSAFLTSKMLTLRTDYGSSWEGDIIIKNSSISPKTKSALYVISGSNKGDHDYGYECHMPTNVYIDGLITDNATKVYVFANLNSNCKSESYVPKYPYIATKKVTVTNTDKAPILCENKYLLANTEYICE